MIHFNYLEKETYHTIFYKRPVAFNKASDKETLAHALGATLYMPATRDRIARDIIDKRIEGLSSMVICLEDAIGDNEVSKAEKSLIHQLSLIQEALDQEVLTTDDLPLIFIRVRNHLHLKDFSKRLESLLGMITGFVFPKFTSSNGQKFLETLVEINHETALHLYGMPILESPEVIFIESRKQELLAIKTLLDAYQELILNIRIGATDFCGAFGIRRSSDTTIYDISIVRDCISDMVNLFGRAESNYVLSAPVWEYFDSGERILKPQLRQTPFVQTHGQTGLRLRQDMIQKFEDGLIKELLLDKANGLLGKTIIHPSHIKPVQALNVVTYEEYVDAQNIIESANGNVGVMKSEYANKMNEVKPHYNWAKKILSKSTIYGVYHEQQSYIDLLAEREKVFI